MRTTMSRLGLLLVASLVCYDVQGANAKSIRRLDDDPSPVGSPPVQAPVAAAIPTAGGGAAPTAVTDPPTAITEPPTVTTEPPTPSTTSPPTSAAAGPTASDVGEAPTPAPVAAAVPTQPPNATTEVPTAVSSPTAVASSPTATVLSPTATVSSPTAVAPSPTAAAPTNASGEPPAPTSSAGGSPFPTPVPRHKSPAPTFTEDGSDATDTTDYSDYTLNPPTDQPIQYVPPDDDPVKEEPGYEDGDGEGFTWNEGESPEKMLHDPNVVIAVGVVCGVALLLMIFTAQQMLENPDGFCAGLCRLFVSCTCCIFRSVCPCLACCCGNKRSRNHIPVANGNDHYTHDLELT